MIFHSFAISYGWHTVSATDIVSPRSFNNLATSVAISLTSFGGKPGLLESADMLVCLIAANDRAEILSGKRPCLRYSIPFLVREKRDAPKIPPRETR